MRVFDSSPWRIAAHRSDKWTLMARALAPSSWLQLVPCPAVTREDLVRVHDAAYVDAFVERRLSAAALRRIGLGDVVSDDVLARVLHVTGGTVAAARHVLAASPVPTACAVIGGGAHHAHGAWGSGYCVMNDLAVAAGVLCDAGLRVLVLDVDVHQGDGTATMLHGMPGAFTVSLHAKKNFPFRKSASDVDVELDDGTGDEAYLATLQHTLDRVQRLFPAPRVVLYQGGVDVLRGDRLGRLSLTLEGTLARDRVAFEWCRAQGASVVCTSGGGYADGDSHSLATVVQAHVQQVLCLANVYAKS